MILAKLFMLSKSRSMSQNMFAVSTFLLLTVQPRIKPVNYCM